MLQVIYSCRLRLSIKRLGSITQQRLFSKMHRSPAAMMERTDAENVTINTPRDPNTLSNYNNFRTTHTAVKFIIDFQKQSLSGNVALNMRSISDAETREIVLDTSYLDIGNIKVAGKPAKWNISPRVEPYGSPLSIKLENTVKQGEELEVDIEVSTTKDCTALQWLTPAQTSNGKHPYMFSQCQAIHARSLFPCQDTPDVKSTFDFKISSPLPVLCSGLPQDTKEESKDSSRVYHFQQNVKMPSYLFAIASGDIAEAPIGQRSSVCTSPDQLKSSQWELERDMEKFLEAAESIVYPYAWGTYNVLVLPPSFPYGGMENPIYTFATPTIISGDRQNVDVIAHELSHSWSGNLVSNASWEHFWLNEGWTTYLERRIQAAIHGEPYRDFSAIIGWKALTDSIVQLGEDHDFTKLVVDLKGKDPDDAFSSVPYEKGFVFLYHLEKLLGKDKWDKFIPHYFTKFKEQSLDSYDFKATLLSFFEDDKAASNALGSLDWDKWFYTPGFPPKPDFNTTMVDVCYDLADKWKRLIPSDGAPSSEKWEPSYDDVADLAGNQIVVFLETIQLFHTPLTPNLSQRLGSVYKLTTSKNVEITSRYYRIALKARDRSVLDGVAELLSSVGRMKFVRPLYKALVAVDERFAKSLFQKNRDFYHPICRALVEKDLYGSK